MKLTKKRRSLDFQEKEIVCTVQLIEQTEIVWSFYLFWFTYNYQQKNLPNEILKIFDNSLHNNNILTRNLSKCSLKPKKELKRGNLMYEILNNWNETNKSIRDEPNLRAFKRKIMDFQNEFVKCNKENCYSCH